MFPKDQVEAAYRYMAAGKHIGKVVIKMREDKEPLDKPALALPRYHCFSDRTYVILGGLGGFGLELGKFIISKILLL